MSKSYVAAQRRIDDGDGDPFYPAKQRTAFYYVTQILPQAAACHARIAAGADALIEEGDDWFDAAY